MLPWTEKYKPKFDEIACSQESKSKLKAFIANFGKQKKAVLLYGPSGCGKTAAVYALASQLGYEVIELNASDLRNKQEIEKIVGKASRQQSLFARGKIILIDELEGISPVDRGSIQEIIRLIEKTSWPIVLIANDPWQEKLRPLHSKVVLIEFKKAEPEVVARILAKIAEKEKINIPFELCKLIALANECDVRASINDLQLLGAIKKPITKQDLALLHGRKKDKNIFEALRAILKTKLPVKSSNVFDAVQNMDENDFLLWLDENIPREYNKDELVRAYETLSKADIFRGRIRRWQHWRFLFYVMLLITAGISNAKNNPKEGFTSYKPPSRILKIWLAKQKLAEKMSIVEKLAKATHCSKKVASKEFEYLKFAFDSKQKIQEIAKELNLEEKEIEWLKKNCIK